MSSDAVLKGNIHSVEHCAGSVHVQEVKNSCGREWWTDGLVFPSDDVIIA